MKRGAPNHPKVMELAEALNVRRVTAIGHLELLFHFTAQYAPQGDIGRYSDKRIAAAMDWAGKPAKLIDGLVTTGWVDRDDRVRLVVHDWSDHLDRTLRQRLARQGKKPFQANQAHTGKVCTQNETHGKQINTNPVPVPTCVPKKVHTPVPESDLSVRLSQSLSPEEWEAIIEAYPGKVQADQDMRLYVSHVQGEHEKFRKNLEAWKRSSQWRRGFVESLGKFIETGQWKVKPPVEQMKSSKRLQMEDIE